MNLRVRWAGALGVTVALLLTTALSWAAAAQATRPAGSTYAIQVVGEAGVPSGAVAASINFAAVNALDWGFLTAYPCGVDVPKASTVNYLPGDTVANGVIVPIGADGKVCVYTSGRADIIADISGWFTADQVSTVVPTRLADTRDEPSGVRDPGDTGGGGGAGGGSGGGGAGGGSGGGSGGGGGGSGGGGGTPPDYSVDFDDPSDLSEMWTGVHHRDDILVAQTSWTGDHDLSCGDSSTQRTIHRGTPDESFYICNGHLHTSVGDTSGYSIAWFSPGQVFSRSEQRTVSWSVNITDLGARQWWEVVIVPSGAPFLTTAPFVATTAGVAPYDASTIAVGSGPFGNDGSITTNGVDRDPLGLGQICMGGTGQVGCDSKDILRSFQVTDNLDGTITVDFLGVEYTYPGVFPDRYEVYFNDHNFTPDKDGVPVGHTWHWDDIDIS